MPYIPKGTRRQYEANPVPVPLTAGELNFVVARVVDDYIAEFGLSYKTLNEVVGALECCKLEIYRRIAAPYEDSKLAEHGDVFTFTHGDIYKGN